MLKTSVNSDNNVAVVVNLSLQDVTKTPGVYEAHGYCDRFFVSSAAEPGVVTGFNANGSPFHVTANVWGDDRFFLSTKKFTVTFYNE